MSIVARVTSTVFVRTVAMLLAFSPAAQAMVCAVTSPIGGVASGTGLGHGAAALSPLPLGCEPGAHAPDPAVTDAARCPVERWPQALPPGKAPACPRADGVVRGPLPVADGTMVAVADRGGWPHRPRWLLTARLRI